MIGRSSVGDDLIKQYGMVISQIIQISDRNTRRETNSTGVRFWNKKTNQ